MPSKLAPEFSDEQGFESQGKKHPLPAGVYDLVRSYLELQCMLPV